MSAIVGGRGDQGDGCGDGSDDVNCDIGIVGAGRSIVHETEETEKNG